MGFQTITLDKPNKLKEYLREFTFLKSDFLSKSINIEFDEMLTLLKLFIRSIFFAPDHL